MNILEIVVLGNSIHAWIIASLFFVSTVIVLTVAKKIAVQRLGVLSQKTATKLDDLIVDLIKDTRFYFFFTLAVFGALHLLNFQPQTLRFADRIVFLISMVQVFTWGSSIITFWVEYYIQLKANEDTGLVTTMGLFGSIAKFMFFGLIFLLTLNNFGVNITALVAGLGVGGIAVALAVQNILGDLFASLTIVLDKPFVVGDFIVSGEHQGTVERIGLKTTRIRSLSGEQLIFPNSDLLQSRLRNFKRMAERRVIFLLNITYECPHEKLILIPQIIRKIVEKREAVRFERSNFKGYATSSLEFETVYWVKNPDFNKYAEIHEGINLDIFKEFKREGIQFAYPTQVVYTKPASPSLGSNQ